MCARTNTLLLQLSQVCIGVVSLVLHCTDLCMYMSTRALVTVTVTVKCRTLSVNCQCWYSNVQWLLYIVQFFHVQYWFSVVQCCCPKSLTFVVVPYCCPMLLSNVIVPIRQAWGGIPVPEYFPFPNSGKALWDFLWWFNGKQLTKMVKYNRFIQFKDFLMNFIHLSYILSSI